MPEAAAAAGAGPAAIELAFFTVVTGSYLPRARVLCESVMRAHPGAPCHVVLADVRDPEIDACAAEAGFEPVYLDQLGLPSPERFTFRYNVVELCTAIKPYAFAWLFAHTGARHVVYLDPDIEVHAPLAPVAAAFAAGAAVVLTPHLTGPIDDDRRPGEIDILRAGAYNLGFIAIARGAVGDALVAWWSRRLEHGALVDLKNGLFTDQRWIDLVPGMFGRVHISHDPGLNLAYWNLAQRRVDRVDGRWQVDGGPLIFAHFSGLDPLHPHNLSRHQDRYTLESCGPFRGLAEAYVARLFEAGEMRWRDRPYAWGRLADGTPVIDLMRAVFRRLWDRDGGPDPRRLAAADFNRPTALLPRWGNVAVSCLVHEYWRTHAGTMGDGPLTTAAGQEAYMDWLRPHARESMKWPEALVPQAAPAARRRAGRPPVAWRLRQWTYNVLHETYLGAPAGLKAAILRHRPQFLRNYVRERMIPVLHAGAPPRLFRPPRSGSLQPGLSVVGHLAYSFGLGETGRMMIRACETAGLAFNTVNIELKGRRLHDEPVPNAAEPAAMRDVALFCVNADGTLALPAALRAEAVPGQYRIGHWYWELEGFPPQWNGAFGEVDELWAGSPFIRDCLAAVSPCPVVYISQPIEARLQRAYRRAEFGLPEGKFLFLFTFDFDSYVERKNPRACIEAFRRAFPQDDGAALVIKTLHGDRHPQALAALRDEARADPRMHVLDLSLPRNEILGLISVCDVYLSLHRSEGLGQGMGEAMCLGRAVVATGYSGNLAFMREDNSCLVKYRMVPVAAGAYPFGGGQSWAEPDLEDAAGHMRRLADDPALRARLGENAARFMAEHFSAAACGERIAKRLAIIRSWRDST